jgi:precorrin-2 dehydrogenase/sirohydrochlorin ferrochelatase
VTATGAFGFPIFVEVRGRRVFVALGSHESDAKAETLAELGADVSAYRVSDGPFDPRLLDGAVLAVVGTGDRVVDHQIAAACRERALLVNTVDDIPWCDWSAPAILRRGDLTLAIGTGGIAPALAARLRDAIGEDLVGPEYEPLLELFAEVRPEIARSGRSFRERRALWYRLVDGPAVDLIRRGDRAGARAEVENEVKRWEAQAA